MELVNQTAAAAEVAVKENADGSRAGTLVVKTTWEASASRSGLVTEDPEAVLAEDTPTELGILPNDVGGWSNGRIEVLLLGRAYSPQLRAAESMDVWLCVGDVARSAHVIGDRVARFAEGRWHFGPPAPFESIPLTWERAMFAPASLWLDDATAVPVPLALLADPAAAPTGLGEYLGLPAGFPRLQLPERAPNVWKSPQSAATGEVGHPECWSPAAPSDLHRMLELRALFERDKRPTAADATRHLASRAHPGWQLETIPDRALVRAIGLVPEGEWSFPLPSMRVWADYEVGARSGSAQAALRRLVLLPDQRRFYLVHELPFATRVAENELRSIRVRLE